jgi:hypothetical protein
MEAQGSCEQQLQGLLRSGRISGVALAGHAGRLHFAHGDLELPRDSPATESPAAVHQFVAAFRSAAPATAFQVHGERCVVVSAHDASYFAVSRQRRLGVSVIYLQGGVLVVTYRRHQLGAAAEVAALAQRLAWRPPAPL